MNKKLTKSLETYLLAIDTLLNKNNSIIVKDVAQYLNIGAASTAEAVKKLNKSDISAIDILIKSGHMRMVKKDNQWELHNTRTKDIALFEKMGFIPSLTYTI